MLVALFSERPQLFPEDYDNCHNCSELDHNVEHFDEILGFVEIQKLLNNDEMSRRTDREPFRDTFNDTEKNGFNDL